MDSVHVKSPKQQHEISYATKPIQPPQKQAKEKWAQQPPRINSLLIPNSTSQVAADR